MNLPLPRKNLQSTIRRELASLALFAAFILSIGFASVGPAVYAQVPSADDFQDARSTGYESCETSNNQRTGEVICQAYVGGVTGLGSAILDPIGTIENLFGDLTGGSGTPTSFTDFDGGLLPPSTEGYSSGLVQQTNARDFILAVTNFILGFLGLIAVLIVIYGGFLYLTAAGSEDQAGKGKKSITYAIIGIMLILGSYALVNTILQAPSGDDQTGTLSGSAPAVTTGFVSDSSFPGTVGNILDNGSVNGIAAGNIGDTSTPEGNAAAQRQLFYLASNQIVTLARDLLTAYLNYAQINLGLQEFVKVPSLGTSSDLAVLMESKMRLLEAMQRTAAPIGNFQDYVPMAQGVLLDVLQRSRTVLVNEEGDETKWREWWIGQLQGEISGGDGTLAAEANRLRTANEGEFGAAIERAKEEIARLEERFGVMITPIQDAFADVNQKLNGLLASAGRAKENIIGSQMQQVLESMAALYDRIKNTPFMYVVIAASTVDGSAPLIVNFDGLRSMNPMNVTIPGENYEWNFGDTGSTQNTATGPTTTHIFSKPGTYVVQLKVGATDAQVADGLATMRITVREPANRIFLKSIIGEEIFDLRRYDPETGNLLIDQSVLKVSSSEAEAGIIFDASETDATRLRSVKWSFGDGSQETAQTGSSIQLEQTHTYTPGTYQMYLEVTDTQNNVDRKVVNIVVGSPVARITAQGGNIGMVDQKFTLDGSTSMSDGGSIASYEWTDTGADKATRTLGTTGEKFEIAFSETGTYEVTLTVVDNLGKTNSQTLEIEVKSQPPVAQFNSILPDATQPGTVHFDGALSYDPDSEAEELKYEWIMPDSLSEDSFDVVRGTLTSENPQIMFMKAGTYTIGLRVTDSDAQVSELVQKEVVITNTLDIAWGVRRDTTGMLEPDENGQMVNSITTSIRSVNGVAYEVDFGDGEIENGEIEGDIATFSHNYRQAGKFIMKATVFDAEDNENSIARKVFISSGDTPVAVAGVQVNGVEVADTTVPVKAGRKDVITLDAGNSLNTDGTGRRLNYSWDMGNGQRSTQERVTQRYSDIGTYTVSLRVTSSADVTKTSEIDVVTIEVVGEPPVLRGITAVPAGNSLTTPVTVTLSAVGAEDRDGRITRYRWWYYDPSSNSEELGVQVTTGPTATVTIGTRGEEGDQRTYQFGVIITDDENNSTSSLEALGEVNPAQLTVTNGPNKPPVASFTVDRTSVMAGDIVNFVSTSRDPDGQIVGYYWDFEGDGFADNNESRGANVSRTFTEVNREGVRVRLKVKDNNESEAISQPVTIFIEGFAKPPVSDFSFQQQGTSKRVSFRSNATADKSAGAQVATLTWDFNTAVDTNGDGTPNNDRDATGENVTYEYDDYGVYRASLTVTDDQQNTHTKTGFVRVIKPAETAALITADTGSANILGTGAATGAAVLVTTAGFAILLIRLKKNIHKK